MVEKREELQVRDVVLEPSNHRMRACQAPVREASWSVTYKENFNAAGQTVIIRPKKLACRQHIDLSSQPSTQTMSFPSISRSTPVPPISPFDANIHQQHVRDGIARN